MRDVACSRGGSPSSTTSCSISGPRSTGSNRARASSASVRAASPMSPISRSSRTTSWRTTSISCLRSFGILDPVEAVDRRAQRGERVLELVGDVGGEGLDIVDPLPQRLAHVADRAGEQADLVAPRGQARHLDLARPAEPDPVRGERQPAQRPDDGPRQEQRQQDRQDRRPAPCAISERPRAGCARCG